MAPFSSPQQRGDDAREVPEIQFSPVVFLPRRFTRSSPSLSPGLTPDRLQRSESTRTAATAPSSPTFSPAELGEARERKGTKWDCRTDQPVWMLTDGEKISFAEEIGLFVRYIGTTSGETAVKLDLINRIKLALLQRWPGLEVRSYGSFMSGLSLVMSDIDLTVIDRKHVFENSEHALFNIFKFLCSLRRSERDPFPLAVCQQTPNEFAADPFCAPLPPDDPAGECRGLRQGDPPGGQLGGRGSGGSERDAKEAEGRTDGEARPDKGSPCEAVLSPAAEMQPGRAAQPERSRQAEEVQPVCKMCSFCITEHYYTKGRGVHATKRHPSPDRQGGATCHANPALCSVSNEAAAAPLTTEPLSCSSSNSPRVLAGSDKDTSEVVAAKTTSSQHEHLSASLDLPSSPPSSPLLLSSSSTSKISAATTSAGASMMAPTVTESKTPSEPSTPLQRGRKEHTSEEDFAELPETLAPYIFEGNGVTAENYYTDWFYPEQLEEISTARVPLIKLTDARSRCSIDITLNQTNGAGNTASMRALVGLYPVVRPVTVLLKYLLRILNYNEVYTGGLSAYTVAVMTAFVAQNLRLLRRCYKEGEEEDAAVVLLEFLRFYGFNAELFAAYGISLGDRTPGGGRLYSKSERGWHGDHLSVEDPYDRTSDAARGCFKMDQVLSLFFDVYHLCVRRNDVFRVQPDPARRRGAHAHSPLLAGLCGEKPAIPSLSIPSLSADAKYFPRRSVLSKFLFVPCEVKRQKNHYYILATHLRLAVNACERCGGGQMGRFTLESPKSKVKGATKMPGSQ